MAAADAMGHRILVVDDNRTNLLLLEQVLAAEGHQVEVASDGAEALQRISAHSPDLILLDLDMPRIDGYEVCYRVKTDSATHLIPVIILTAQTAFEAKLRAWELGADDFLTKPFQNLEVVARCRSLLRVKGLVDALDSAEAVVFAFARAIEVKSPYTQGHSERVATYALLLAAQFGLPEMDWETLRKGSLLHDIGKISIPDAILDKPGKLTAAELDIVKQHPVQGARIVESLRSIRDTVPLIRWHHERLDGKGYPDGLAGDEIPLLVRILSVVDVYDSLSSKRPYRSVIPHDFCLELLQSNAAGGGLDPEVVRCFAKVPSLGTPAALEGLDRVWACFPERPVLAPVSLQGSLGCGRPTATNGNGKEAATATELIPTPDMLSRSWSWQDIQRMRAGLPASASHGDEALPE